MKTAIFNIHDLILILTIAVCLLLATFQLLLSKQKKVASYLVSIFFVSIAVNALCNLLLWNDYIHITSHAIKTIIAYSFGLIIVIKGISLYLYVVAITRENFQIDKQNALHFIGILFTLGLLTIGHIDSDKLRFITQDTSLFDIYFTSALWHFLKVTPVIYAGFAVWSIIQYKKQLKEFYSTLSLEGPQWLMLLALGFTLNWAWSLIVHIIGQSSILNTTDSLGIFDNYFTFILVNALFVYSLGYAHQLLETKTPVKKQEPPIETEKVSNDAIARIKKGIEEDELYLRQNLNIEEFSKHVGINYREVSIIINKHFDTNFFEFVNSYRVKKATSMLTDPKFAETTILDILFESGFNSKSAFHRFFKRYNGMSAAEFRKRHAATQTNLPSASEKKKDTQK